MAVLTPWLWVVFFAAGGVYAQQIEMRAQDEAFYAHGFIFFAFCAAGLVFALREALRKDRYVRPADVNGTPDYNEGIVRAGVIVSTFWGIVGFTVGLWLALQLAFRSSISTCRGPISADCGHCTHRLSFSHSAAMCLSRHLFMSSSGPVAPVSPVISRRGSCSGAISSFS